MQTVTRNPLASPDVIGVGHGTAAATVLALSTGVITSPGAMPAVRRRPMTRAPYIGLHVNAPDRRATAADIVASVQREIETGSLPAGSRLPPVRALEKQLGLSKNTAQAAYDALAERLSSAFGDAPFLRHGLPVVVDGHTFESSAGP